MDRTGFADFSPLRLIQVVKISKGDEATFVISNGRNTHELLKPSRVKGYWVSPMGRWGIAPEVRRCKLGSLARWQHHLGAGGGLRGRWSGPQCPGRNQGPVGAGTSPWPPVLSAHPEKDVAPSSGPSPLSAGTRFLAACEEEPSWGAGARRGHLSMSREAALHP